MKWTANAKFVTDEGLTPIASITKLRMFDRWSNLNWRPWNRHAVCDIVYVECRGIVYWYMNQLKEHSISMLCAQSILKIFTVRAVDIVLLLWRSLIQLFKWSWSESSDKVYVNCCVSWCDGLPHVFICVIMVWSVWHMLNYSFDHDINYWRMYLSVRSWSESFETFTWKIYSRDLFYCQLLIHLLEHERIVFTFL